MFLVSQQSRSVSHLFKFNQTRLLTRRSINHAFPSTRLPYQYRNFVTSSSTTRSNSNESPHSSEPPRTKTRPTFPSLASRISLQTAKLSFLLFLISACGLKTYLHFWGPDSDNPSDFLIWYALFDDLITNFERIIGGPIPILSLPHYLQGRTVQFRSGLEQNQWPSFLNFLVLWRGEVERARKDEQRKEQDRWVGGGMHGQQDKQIPIASDDPFLGRSHLFARAASAAFPPDLLIRLGMCDDILGSLGASNLGSSDSAENLVRQKTNFMHWYSGLRVVAVTKRPEEPTLLSETTKFPQTKHVTRPFAWVGVAEEGNDKTIVVSIRGTINIEDAITDALCDSKLICVSKLREKILSLSSSSSDTEEWEHSIHQAAQSVAEKSTDDSSVDWLTTRMLRKKPSLPLKEDNTDVDASFSSSHTSELQSKTPLIWAHEGMLLSAQNVLHELIPAISDAVEREKATRIVFTGASLGGGSAQLCGLILWLLLEEEREKYRDETNKDRNPYLDKLVDSLEDIEVFAFAPPPVLAVVEGEDQEKEGDHHDQTRISSGIPSSAGMSSSPRLTSYCFTVEEDIVTRLSVGNILKIVSAMRTIDSLNWGLVERINYIVGNNMESIDSSIPDLNDNANLAEKITPSQSSSSLRSGSGFEFDGSSASIPQKYRLGHLSCDRICTGSTGNYYSPHVLLGNEYVRIESIDKGKGEISTEWVGTLVNRVKVAVTGNVGNVGSAQEQMQQQKIQKTETDVEKNANENSESNNQVLVRQPSLLFDEEYRVVRVLGTPLGDLPLPIWNPSLFLNHSVNFYENGIHKAMHGAS